VVRIVRSAVNAEIEASIGSTVERSLNFLHFSNCRCIQIVHSLKMKMGSNVQVCVYCILVRKQNM
jgi:hypothetical protein